MLLGYSSDPSIVNKQLLPIDQIVKYDTLLLHADILSSTKFKCEFINLLIGISNN